MENPLHAAHYADRACQAQVRVVENVQLARDTYRVRFDCPEIARRIVPGQFLMLRLAGCNDPLLGRPLALYDTVLDAAGQPVGVDIVYLVVGKMTRRLATFQPGQPLEVWGPLGNGFPPTRRRAPGDGRRRHRPDAVSGAGPRVARSARYGDPPRPVAPAARVTLCYGARSRTTWPASTTSRRWASRSA